MRRRPRPRQPSLGLAQGFANFSPKFAARAQRAKFCAIRACGAARPLTKGGLPYLTWYAPAAVELTSHRPKTQGMWGRRVSSGRRACGVRIRRRGMSIATSAAASLGTCSVSGRCDRTDSGGAGRAEVDRRVWAFAQLSRNLRARARNNETKLPPSSRETQGKAYTYMMSSPRARPLGVSPHVHFRKSWKPPTI